MINRTGPFPARLSYQIVAVLLSGSFEIGRIFAVHQCMLCNQKLTKRSCFILLVLFLEALCSRTDSWHSFRFRPIQI